MYLLFDIGGTNMRVAVSGDGQTVGKSKTIPTPPDLQDGLQALNRIGDELSGGKKILGLAGGIAVVFDKNKNTFTKSTHLKSWVNQPIKENLEKMFGVPVKLENDSAMAALGEAVYGSGQDKNIVAYIGIGTGAGGARIVDKKIDKNSLGFEPGHQVIVIDGKDCRCGGKGHLEAYVSGWYLQKEYGTKAKDIKDTEVWDTVAKYLAAGLVNTIVHWSPDIVVLGGSVVQSIPLEKLRYYLKEKLTIFPETPEVIPARLGQEAGLYGALAYIMADP